MYEGIVRGTSKGDSTRFVVEWTGINMDGDAKVGGPIEELTESLSEGVKAHECWADPWSPTLWCCLAWPCLLSWPGPACWPWCC